MALKIDATLDRKLTSTFINNMRNLGNFHKSTFESLIIGSLMGSFYPKYIYELKIHRGVFCHDNEEWYQIWTEIDLSVQNWHKEFDEFWPEHLKISKICTLMSFFWAKYIMFDLKKYRGVMYGSTENWCNIWRKTDLCF